MRALYIFFLVIILSQCKQAEAPVSKEVGSENRAEGIVGEWYSEILEYTLDYGTDSAQQQVIRAEEFPERYQMSAVQAIYKADSSFTSSYIGLDGEVLRKEEGHWFLNQDSLVIIYGPAGKLDTFQYAFQIDENIGTFITRLDWDGDGFKDDFLSLESRKEN